MTREQSITITSHDSAQAPSRAKKTRLSVADLITTGVMSALYFVIVALCALLSNVTLGVAGNILLPAYAALLAGPIYMLLAARVKAFGGITIMGTVLGLFLFVSGHFITSFITSIVFSALADLIARNRSKLNLMLSYIVFSFGCTGPILPLWMMKDAYVDSLVRKGKDASYIDALFAHVNGVTFAGAMIAIVIAALLGGFFGMRMMKKHFTRAGVA